MKRFSKYRRIAFSFLDYLFFVLEILTLTTVLCKWGKRRRQKLFYLANSKNTESRISLEILRQCSSKLAPEMFITKETKCHPLWHCHDNGFAAGPVLIKTEIPNNLLRREWYLVFDRKRLEPWVLSWQWHKGCHPVSFVM